MRLLSLDPGESTGWALFDGETPVDWGILSLWEGLDTFLDRTCPQGIIHERFALYGNKAGAMVGNEFLPAQVVGVTKYLAAQRAIPILAVQPASLIHIRPGVLTPPMKRWVAQYKTKTDHERDALCHGHYALRYGKLKAH